MKRFLVVIAIGAVALFGPVAGVRADDPDTDTRGAMHGAVYENVPSFSLYLAGTFDGLPAAYGYSCEAYEGPLVCERGSESPSVGFNAPVELSGEYTFTGTADAWVLSAVLTGRYSDEHPLFRAAGTYDLTCSGGRDPLETAPDENWPGIFGLCTLT